MDISTTRTPALPSMQSAWPMAVGIALALACLFAPPPAGAQPEYRGADMARQHTQGHAMHQGGYSHGNGYGNGHGHGNRYGHGYRGRDRGWNGGYGYREQYDYYDGAPPVIYAPYAAPGISVVLPI